MRLEFDFGPLFRSSVGFDRMLDALGSATQIKPNENYPLYDIERTGEDAYRVTLAVAGFQPDELTVTVQQNLLVVSGERRSRADAANDNKEHRHLLHRGIAARAFTRRFGLASNIKVAGVKLADGLLIIELRREVPEVVRSRRIAITHDGMPPERRRPQATGGSPAA